MKSTKDVNGVDVKIFDKIVYPAKQFGRKGPMTLRVATVVGIVKRSPGWRKTYEGEIKLKVSYKNPDPKYSMWDVESSITTAGFMILPKAETTEKAS